MFLQFSICRHMYLIAPFEAIALRHPICATRNLA